MTIRRTLRALIAVVVLHVCFTVWACLHWDSLFPAIFTTPFHAAQVLMLIVLHREARRP